ncbi:MAG: hypothetical protein H7177_12910 [Rhizobacter sp.]|nr:hypothetical protein [Bacteriovorax sp.]
MNNSRLQTKAIAIDKKAEKNKLIYAGAALLVGVLAAAFFSPKASAQTTESQRDGVVSNASLSSDWTPKLQIQDEIVLPFQLKLQKLSH